MQGGPAPRGVSIRCREGLKVILLTACTRVQPTLEMRIPGEEWGGIFTYHLIRELDRHPDYAENTVGYAPALHPSLT